MVAEQYHISRFIFLKMAAVTRWSALAKCWLSLHKEYELYYNYRILSLLLSAISVFESKNNFLNVGICRTETHNSSEITNF